MLCVPFSPKKAPIPLWRVKTIEVPLGTGTPLIVAKPVTSTHSPAFGLALLVVRTRFRPPFPPPPAPGFGAVGLSEEQAVMKAIAAINRPARSLCGERRIWASLGLRQLSGFMASFIPYGATEHENTMPAVAGSLTTRCPDAVSP